MARHSGGVRVGRIFGIDITIDWSWLIIFFLITLSLAAALFPQWHPDWSAALDWGVAVAAVLLFFGSILLHELAHSVVARARNLPVHRITLFLFGGVSNLEREPASPGTEFVMALVGPLTSVILGFALLFIFSALNFGQLGTFTRYPHQLMSGLGPVSTLLFWLGEINILIGIFNMIPGFPLDGGRVVRSIIWAATGSLRKATEWAAGLGQGIAWFFIGIGIAMAFGLRIPFFGTGFIGGLWLVFIGWFLNNAAMASRQQVLIADVLQDVPVSRLMRPAMRSVPGDLPVSSLVHDWIMGTEERAFLVMDGDRLSGLVCLEDVRKIPRNEWESHTVVQVMTPADRLVVTTPQEEASDALRKLNSNDVRQLPVMDGSRIVGILRLSDVVRWLHLHEEMGHS